MRPLVGAWLYTGLLILEVNRGELLEGVLSGLSVTQRAGLLRILQFLGSKSLGRSQGCDTLKLSLSASALAIDEADVVGAAPDKNAITIFFCFHWLTLDLR